MKGLTLVYTLLKDNRPCSLKQLALKRNYIIVTIIFNEDNISASAGIFFSILPQDQCIILISPTI